MILINKGSKNKLILTLNEKLKQPSNEFHFEFKNDFSGGVITMSMIDESMYKTRYNEFSLEEPNDVEFKIGFYSYSVKDDFNNILEVGKLQVLGTQSSNIYYQQPLNEKVFYTPQNNNNQ
jgi:hypothetical protein